MVTVVLLVWKFALGSTIDLPETRSPVCFVLLQEKEATQQLVYHMKIIFLDIDGVLALAHRKPFDADDSTFDPSFFEPRCVEALKAIVESCGGAGNVRIILSSTWRQHAQGVECVNSVLEGAGLHCVFGCTPGGGTRGDQILACVGPTSQPASSRSVELGVHDNFVILDDFPVSRNFIGTTKRILDGAFVRTDPAKGLTEADAARAISILNATAALTDESGWYLTDKVHLL